jgi:hypothetical protein
MKSLCFVATPLAEESPSSVIVRTAYRNGFLSAHTMAWKLNLPEKNCPLGLILHNNSMCNLLCREAPQFYEKLKSTFYEQKSRLISRRSEIMVAGVVVPWSVLRRHQVFCPLCLEEGHMKYIQDFYGILVCPYHHVEYLTNCPICDQPFDWLKILGSHCTCGFDLRKSPYISSDDDCGLMLLEMFRNKNQDALTRSFAALKCMKYQYLTEDCFPQAFKTALGIGLQNEKCLYNHIALNINKFKNMNIKAIIAPWLRSEDSWIKSKVTEFDFANHSKTSVCQQSECCLNFGLTFQQLNRDLSIHKSILFQAIKSNQLKPIKIGCQYFYTAARMCEFITTSSAMKKRTIIPLDRCRNDYLSLDQAHYFLKMSPQLIKDLYHQGVLGPAIKGHNDAHLLLCTNVKTFHSTYITGNYLATSLRTRPTTLNKILASLGITPENLPRHAQAFTDIYLRTNITSEIIDILKRRLKHKKFIQKGAGFETCAQVLSLTTSRLKAILGCSEFFLQTESKNSTLTKKHMAQLIAWRKKHYTSKETANLLNLTYKAFQLRFFKNTLITAMDIGIDRLYDKQALALMRQNLKCYTSHSDALRAGNFSNTQFKRLVDHQHIHKLQADEPGYSPGVALYSTSDILACRNTIPRY